MIRGTMEFITEKCENGNIRLIGIETCEEGYRSVRDIYESENTAHGARFFGDVIELAAIDNDVTLVHHFNGDRDVTVNYGRATTWVGKMKKAFEAMKA